MVNYDTLEGMEEELLKLVEYDRTREKSLRTGRPDCNRPNITTTLDIRVDKLDFILQTIANSIHPEGECGTGYCLFRGYSPVNGWTPKLMTRQGDYFKLWDKYNLSDGIETSVVWLLQAVLIISDIVGRDISAYDLISGIHDAI